MLKTASRYGGDTLTFGGDAILLLFDGPEHATRAVVAALEMLKQVERAAAVQADDGKVKIGMSVGAHSGTFVLAATGITDERAHLVVLGRGADLTALAEAQAGRGALTVSRPTADLLPVDSSLTSTGDYWRVDELRPARSGASLPRRPRRSRSSRCDGSPPSCRPTREPASKMEASSSGTRPSTGGR